MERSVADGGGEVENDLHTGHAARERVLVADVPFEELDAGKRLHVRPIPRQQVVENDDFLTLPQQLGGEVRPDEPRPSSNQCSHVFGPGDFF
jgi:hypothetical protein